MRHVFEPVSYANLIDSIGIAEKRGGRIRLSDAGAVEAFLTENGLEPFRIAEFGAREGLPLATIISTGLMKGLYLYSTESQRAFVYIATDKDYEPLRIYSGMCYDLAVSYASEELELVRELRSKLDDLGVLVYFLDVSTAPDEPLWAIRFREGLFHSSFFAPILSESYLARHGAALEMFDIARATVHHRRDEFFYPLIPLVRDRSELESTVFANRGEVAGQFDNQQFEWVRTHIFSVPISQGADWLARFFASLARNAKNQFDSGFLDCLAPWIQWIRLHEHSQGEEYRMAEILIPNPVLTYHHFWISTHGVMKYFGMGEPDETARPASDFEDPVGTILDWLGLKRVEAARSLASGQLPAASA